METAIEYAESVCPQHNLSSSITQYFNTTTFPNPVEDLPQFLCMYEDWSQRLASYINRSMIWNSSIVVGLGVPSAILALITFSAKEFRNVSFFYHRYINAVDLIFCINYFFHFLRWCLFPRSMYNLFFLVYGQFVGEIAGMGMQQAAELVTIWVSVERALLCNSPRHFEKINKKWVAWTAVVLSTVLPVMARIPYMFRVVIKWNSANDRYEYVRTEFDGSRSFYTYDKIIIFIQTYAIAILIIPASVVTIVGLIQMNKRNRSLTAKSNLPSKPTTATQNLLNTNSQLCLVQICEAIPIMLCQGLLAVMRSLKGFDAHGLDHLTRMPLEDATWMVTRQYYHFEYLSLCYATSCAIAHSTHFYRYILLSSKVRQAAKRIFFKRGQPVVASESHVLDTYEYITSNEPTINAMEK